jgi:hypothetical protein
VLPITRLPSGPIIFFHGFSASTTSGSVEYMKLSSCLQFLLSHSLTCHAAEAEEL